MYKFPKNFNPGFIPREPDPRDVLFKDLIPFGTPLFDWEEGYDIRDFLNLKVEDQGSSSSCVAQAWAKYAEVKDKMETGKPIDLSARSIYPHIFIPPDGGAWGYKGGSVLIERGIAQESITPSYMNLEPPTEEFMRVADNREIAVRDASIRKIGGYTVVEPDIDQVALSTFINHGTVIGAVGSNEGWQNPYVRPPKSGEKVWGHFFYIGAAKLINGKKFTPFLNSWSENWGDWGWGYLSEDYFKSGYVYSGYSLQDIPNKYLDQINMKRVIMVEGGKDQYIVSGQNKALIPDLETRDFLIQLEIIPIGLPETVTKSLFDSFTTIKPMPSVKADRVNREIYEFYKERLPLLNDSYLLDK